jgi:hypothetical protein
VSEISKTTKILQLRGVFSNQLLHLSSFQNCEFVSLTFGYTIFTFNSRFITQLSVCRHLRKGRLVPKKIEKILKSSKELMWLLKSSIHLYWIGHLSMDRRISQCLNLTLKSNYLFQEMCFR